MYVYSGKLLLLKINKIDLKYAVYDELYLYYEHAKLIRDLSCFIFDNFFIR